MNRLGYNDSKRALALINAVAREPTPTAVRAFDDFFYPLVVQYVRKRHRSIGLNVAATTGATGSAAPLLAGHQVDEAAHATALVALHRARSSAVRVDPARGSPTSWVLRAAGWAYVEVAKQLCADQAELAPVAPDEVAPSRAADPAEVFARQELVDELFLVLSDEERAVVSLVLRYQYTYSEAAEVLLGDASNTKHIDHLLQSARRKLRARWAAMHPNTDR